MAKVNGSYEVVIIFNTKLGEEGIQALIKKFSELIESNGTIDVFNEWGKRKLAYAIEDETEGYYVLYNFTSKPDFPAELDRVLKITDGVLRSLITVK
ncbi:MAG: 30S ribosomal protein S6 [Oscillospiraceae bacterium]